jgi:CheY-like chemotaxis protein
VPQEIILVIEDNDMNMELVSDLLEVAGYVVLQANNAEEGILLARTASPGVILMDLALPGMDGLRATEILKGDRQTRHIPVVALTAHAMQGDKEKALAVGCVGYISKPIDTRSFSRMVARLLEADILPAEALQDKNALQEANGNG